MRLMRCGSVVACLLVTSAPMPRLAAQPRSQLPLLEAVIRYEIAAARKESRASDGAPLTLCVRVRASESAEPVDPDPALLAAFKGARVAVKPGSACVVQNWVVSDRDAGTAATILDIGPVARRGGAQAEVLGAPYAGGRVAREYLYRLQLKGGRWVVHDVELKIVT